MCEGALKPEVVQSTGSKGSPASSVLVLGEEDAWVNDKYNYWLADEKNTTHQGFIVKLDTCARMIAGFQIKNKGKGSHNIRATKEFRLLGSMNENGPWKILEEDELIDTTGGKPASLLNYTFDEPVEIQFLKFEMVSYWGQWGGGLQYLAAVLAKSKQQKFCTIEKRCML